MLKKALIASSILLFNAGAYAEGGYIGIAKGTTDIDVQGFDDGDSVSFTLGYKLDEELSLEVASVDLGESEDNIVPVWTIEITGLNFSAVANHSLNEKVDFFAKVGLFIWDSTLNEAGTGEIGSADGTDLSFGLGLLAHLNENFDVLVEYQNFDLDGDDVSNISVGARFNF